MFGRSEDAPQGDADDRAIASLAGVLRVHRNRTSWYNNASFALPLVATIVLGLIGAVLGSAQVLGFAAFLGAVTLMMLPIVLATWRQAATAVVLTQDAITSLHRGRVLKSLPWTSVTAIRRRETQGNVRWEIAGADGERLLLDGEVEDLPNLLRVARWQAGLPAASLDEETA